MLPPDPATRYFSELQFYNLFASPESVPQRTGVLPPALSPDTASPLQPAENPSHLSSLQKRPYHPVNDIGGYRKPELTTTAKLTPFAHSDLVTLLGFPALTLSPQDQQRITETDKREPLDALIALQLLKLPAMYMSDVAHPSLRTETRYGVNPNPATLGLGEPFKPYQQN